MKNNIIGISGIAGAGKDSLFTLLQANFKGTIKRFALADELKTEIQPVLQSLYGEDIFTCSRETKDILRPMLVAHGKVRRKMSDGRYWINILQNKINDYLKNNPDSIACVTDIRYDVFPKDEVFWIQQEMNGKLIHLTKYMLNGDGEKVYSLPPNEDEAQNDPKVKAKADYRVEWPHVLNKENVSDFTSLNKYAQDIIEFLQK